MSIGGSSEKRPSIALGSLGGTIAMKPAREGEGVSPELSAEDLTGAVPELAKIAQIKATSLCNVASPALTMHDIVKAVDFCDTSVQQGADGVVLTHGTDTLEETAFLLDLLWTREEPIVITGAMRSPNLPGADGPANLVTAVLAAREPNLRGTGVLVALNDEVHAATTVAKTHATSTATFQSPGWGPIARVNEARVDVMARPARPQHRFPVPGTTPMRIPVIEAGLADDGHFIQALADGGAQAIVIAAAGVGHVSEPAADICGALVRDGLPIIFATRTGAGRTLQTSYGYPGSESDLLRRGLIGAGYLSARKARLLAHVALSAGVDIDGLRTAFADWGRS